MTKIAFLFATLFLICGPSLSFADIADEYNSRHTRDQQLAIAQERQKWASKREREMVSAIHRISRSPIVAVERRREDTNNRFCSAWVAYDFFYVRLANGLYCKFPTDDCGNGTTASCTR